jgi:hypothetical protein
VTPIDPIAEEVGKQGTKLSKVQARVELLEERQKPDQVSAAAERGLPPDWMTAEQNVWRKLSPFHGKWPKVTEFDSRVAELEMTQAQVRAELDELHQQAQTAPSLHQQRLANWELGGRQGSRPESQQEQIERRIKELQDESEALTVAVGRILDEKVRYVEGNRGRLVKEADAQTEEARARYLALVDQLASARDELRAARRAAIWSRLYPRAEAGAEPPDSLAGARKRALTPMGVTAAVQPERVWQALRADAEWLATEGVTTEQAAAIANRDVRLPPGTTWSDDPRERQKRAQAMGEWATRR